MISAVVLAKNEEKNISRCLSSIAWCDEIILVDDNSTDRTALLAKKYKAQIFIHPLNDDFSAQRNFGLGKAKFDWVLFVDADERISSALWYEIMQTINSPINNYSGFYLKRIDFMWKKKLNYGESGNVKFLRLVKRDSGKWVGKVHEVWQSSGKTNKLKNPLIHHPHNTVKNFLKEVNYYTTLRASDLYDKNTKINWWSIVVYPAGKFIYNYIFKLGFLDGVQGLVFAVMMSFHSFLVRGKLWSMMQKNEKTQ